MLILTILQGVWLDQSKMQIKLNKQMQSDLRLQMRAISKSRKNPAYDLTL